MYKYQRRSPGLYGVAQNVGIFPISFLSRRVQHSLCTLFPRLFSPSSSRDLSHIANYQFERKARDSKTFLLLHASGMQLVRCGE